MLSLHLGNDLRMMNVAFETRGTWSIIKPNIKGGRVNSPSIYRWYCMKYNLQKRDCIFYQKNTLDITMIPTLTYSWNLVLTAHSPYLHPFPSPNQIQTQYHLHTSLDPADRHYNQSSVHSFLPPVKQ